MDVFIYFYERLPCAVGELEDIIDETLGTAGEVTGTGAGLRGSNLDIVIKDSTLTKERVITILRDALSQFQLPESTRIVVDSESFAFR